MKLALLLCLALAPVLSAADLAPPRVFSFSGQSLAAAKASLQRGETALVPARDELLKEADRLLAHRPASVMDKTKVGVSGDMHDYYSQAPYWWPDPSKPDGKPFLRRDGAVYPDSKIGTDSVAFARTCNAVETLGLAYYFSGKEVYAEKAALLARVWFLNPETRMNPHLNYGQAVPGRSSGREEGVLEARHLAGLTDGLTLLSGANAWTADDAARLTDWLSRYYEWLTHAPVALKERAAKNNHGSWYDAQTAHLALFLGRTDDARRIVEEARTVRVARQIEPDGTQPLEFARTKSLDYCVFNLSALLRLCTVARNAGVDLYPFRTSDGRSIREALLRVAPYADPEKVWPKKDLVQEERAHLPALMAQALTFGTDSDLESQLQRRLAARPDASARWRLLWAPEPSP